MYNDCTTADASQPWSDALCGVKLVIWHPSRSGNSDKLGLWLEDLYHVCSNQEHLVGGASGKRQIGNNPDVNRIAYMDIQIGSVLSDRQKPASPAT